MKKILLTILLSSTILNTAAGQSQSILIENASAKLSDGFEFVKDCSLKTDGSSQPAEYSGCLIGHNKNEQEINLEFSKVASELSFEVFSFQHPIVAARDEPAFLCRSWVIPNYYEATDVYLQSNDAAPILKSKSFIAFTTRSQFSYECG